MKHERAVHEHVTVSDSVQREMRGKRHKKNPHAIFALISITVFEALIIVQSTEFPYLAVHWFLSFVVFFAGSFAIKRIENYLRITTRPKNLGKKNSNQNSVRRRCNNCNNLYNEHSPCPRCGESESTIIGVVNDTISILESTTAVISNFRVRTSLLGLGIFGISFGLQWYASFLVGTVIALTISMLMSLILFIPSYYSFFTRYIVDKEHVV